MLTQLKELISDVIKTEGVSTEIVEKCGKMNQALDDANKQLEKKEKEYKELQDKYKDVILHYPVSTKEDTSSHENDKPKSLEDCLDEVLKARENNK